MKISKSSWHYWLVSKFNNEYQIPHSLCPYVRKLLASMIWSTLFAWVIAAMIAFFIASPIVFWLDWFGIITAYANWLKMGIAAHVVWAVFIVGFALNHFHETWKERNEFKPAKEPGVFMAYIKAKKEKFCPNIEFVDEIG